MIAVRIVNRDAKSVYCQAIAAEKTSRDFWENKNRCKGLLSQDNVPAVDCRKYKDITRNGGPDEFSIVSLKKVPTELGKNFPSTFSRCLAVLKFCVIKIFNVQYLLHVRSKCYLQRGSSISR